MHQEHKNAITPNKLEQHKPRFGHLLWPLAWQWSRPILKRKGKTGSTYVKISKELECGPMPNVMATLPNIGGALRSMLQNLANAHY